jgi:alpha-tubulin suppressor-like RCC1 family protein
VTTSDNVTSDNLSVNSFTIDATAPSLTQVTPVPTLGNNRTPNYTFHSNEAGDITYGGSCSSSDNSSSVDNNTISFNTLGDNATYSNCTIRVTDSAGNQSNLLEVSSFTIDAIAPSLSQVIAVSTPTNDNTSSYTFHSNEAGEITYAGTTGCASDNITSAVAGDNNITFNELPDGTYSCTIRVTDNASNTSSLLSVNTFIIDTIDPTVEEEDAVTTPGYDTTPSYTFSSTETGVITYDNESCSSLDNSSSVGDNEIDFRKANGAVLDEGSYSSCTIRVTDNANNQSNLLLVSSFIIDTTAPTVSSTSPADNQSSFSVSENISVTFSESMDNTSVTANTSNTSCSGSFQLSSDNFSSCVQMGSSPSVSNSNRTFTVAPSLTMFYSTNYKIRITIAAKDSAGNFIAQYTQTNGFNRDSIPITAGYAHSCFILDNGSVKCWGENSYGQLGLGDTINRGDNSSEMGDNLTSIDLGTGRTATAIEAGDNHTCAILNNASVKCWGSNASGQLGLGDTSSRGDGSSEMGDNLTVIDLGSGRTAKAIAAGYEHTCAILDNASVKCWGSNASGQLGLGDTNSRGNGSSEMGDNLTAVDLGSGRTATAIAIGGSHTCALLDNSSIKCWGLNDSGQLGQNDLDSRGDSSDEMGDNLDVIDLRSPGKTAASITTSARHTCVLLDDNNTKCWGYGEYGQLGRGEKKVERKPPEEVLDLGTGRTATAIAAGNFHTCAVLDNSSIKCWGLNDSGQLGQGDTSSLGDESNEMGNNLTAVDLGAGKTARAISAGDRHTCAILDNALIKCWGSNTAGQLGLGNTSNRGDNSSEMGDNLPVISL